MLGRSHAGETAGWLRWVGSSPPVAHRQCLAWPARRVLPGHV